LSKEHTPDFVEV